MLHDLYLYHDLNDIIFKIKQKLYIAEWLQYVRKTVVNKTKPNGAGILTICDLNNDKLQLMKFVRNFEHGAAPSDLEKYDVFTQSGGCCPSLVQPEVSRRNISLWSHVCTESQVASQHPTQSFPVIISLICVAELCHTIY
jgi:hypothetical protein